MNMMLKPKPDEGALDKKKSGDTTPQSAQMRLMDNINALPLNPARDHYGIEDKQIQTICFVAYRSVEEAILQRNYSLASNTIGAWLITAGEHLGVLGKDRNIVAMFAEDIVTEAPALIPLARMVADSLAQFVSHSTEAANFCRSIVSREVTHPLVALSFLNLVPPTLSQPWLRHFYNHRFNHLSDSKQAAILQSTHKDLTEAHVKNPELLAARRQYYQALAKKFARFYPQDKVKAPAKHRLLVLIDRLRPLSDPEMKKIMQLAKAFNQSKNKVEIALYVTGESQPCNNQLGYYSHYHEVAEEAITLGEKQKLRKAFSIVKECDHEYGFDQNAKIFLSSAGVFRPQMIVAIGCENSLVKGALSYFYPIIDWVDDMAMVAFTMGAHMVATSLDKIEAAKMLSLANIGRLEDLTLLPLNEEKDLYTCFHDAFLVSAQEAKRQIEHKA